METPSGGPIDWVDLLDWYMSASDVVEELDACLVTVDSMFLRSGSSILGVAESLSAVTGKADQWLVSHPCPEQWVGDQMAAIVHALAEITLFIIDTGGVTSVADQGALIDMSNDTRLLLAEVKGLMFNVTAALDI